MKTIKTKPEKPARYVVFLRRTKTGYSADVPDLPGCIAAAGTLQSTKKLIAEAIGLHLDLIRESGDTIPRPTNTIEFTVDPESAKEICTWVEVRMPRAKAQRTANFVPAKRR
jgi:predicted RNase H-like HicB family nuclease